MMALCGLHHDDEEAYLGDMVGPLKSLGNMAYFRWIARLNQRAILTALDLPLEEPAFVKQIDRDLRIAERSAFMVEAADPQRGTYSDKGWMPSEFRFGTEYVGHSSVDEDFDLGVQGCRRFSYDPACGPIVGQWAEIIARPCSVPSPSLPHLGLEFVIGPWSAEMAAFVFEALHRELCLLSQRTERAHNPARRLER